MLNQVAYPNPAESRLMQAIAFFDRLRYLTVGFFVTRGAGIEDLGYQGNTPIVRD